MEYRLIINGEPGEWIEDCRESLEAMAAMGNELDPGSCVVEQRFKGSGEPNE